jgi:hypothetical protein
MSEWLSKTIEEASMFVVARQRAYEDDGLTPSYTPERYDVRASLVEADAVYQRAQEEFLEAGTLNDQYFYAYSMEARRMQIMECEDPRKVLITKDQVPSDLFDLDD